MISIAYSACFKFHKRTSALSLRSFCKNVLYYFAYISLDITYQFNSLNLFIKLLFYCNRQLSFIKDLMENSYTKTSATFRYNFHAVSSFTYETCKQYVSIAIILNTRGLSADRGIGDASMPSDAISRCSSAGFEFQ